MVTKTSSLASTSRHFAASSNRHDAYKLTYLFGHGCHHSFSIFPPIGASDDAEVSGATYPSYAGPLAMLPAVNLRSRFVQSGVQP